MKNILDGFLTFCLFFGAGVVVLAVAAFFFAVLIIILSAGILTAPFTMPASIIYAFKSRRRPKPELP